MPIVGLHTLYLKFQLLIRSKDGQDLVEYAMVCALLAFGIVAGMSSVAKGIDTAFSNISSTMGSYTT